MVTGLLKLRMQNSPRVKRVHAIRNNQMQAIVPVGSIITEAAIDTLLVVDGIVAQEQRNHAMG